MNIYIQVGKRLSKLLIAYSSIIFGFYFSFSLIFPDDTNMNHMLIRINTLITMMMGEVSMDGLAKGNNNATNPFKENFWTEWKSVDYSGHILFSVFCFTVPILILNILTAFAIKVCFRILSHPVNLPISGCD